MGKIIRPRYPIEFSIGLLLLIFVLSLFFSYEIFQISGVHPNERMYFGMVIVSTAIIIMLLVLWEEFLFPIHVKPIEGGLVFRNHRKKLKTQGLIYSSIPLIFTFVYYNYRINIIPFTVCAAICILAPVMGKLISGIKNYNDFLKLTDSFIEYKNNKKAGTFSLRDVQGIRLIKDSYDVLHKIQLTTASSGEVVIDLDEMELEAYYESINKFIISHFKTLVKVG